MMKNYYTVSKERMKIRTKIIFDIRFIFFFSKLAFEAFVRNAQIIKYAYLSIYDINININIQKVMWALMKRGEWYDLF